VQIPSMVRISRIHGVLLCVVVLPQGSTSFDIDPFSVVTGRHFSFAVDQSAAYATGRNNHGQLGIGSTNDQDSLIEVSLPVDDRTIKEIAAGGFHTLFLTALGNVYGAGWNRFGQLGIGSNADQQDPTSVDLTLGENVSVTGVAAGYAHSLILLSDGTVLAAGLNSAGQLGVGTQVSKNTFVPVDFDAAEKATKIAAGYDFSYVLTNSSKVLATGQNLGGQLGDGTRQTRLRPVEVQVDGVAGIAAGESHGLFLLTDKSVRATGANFDGQLGDDTLDAKMVPSAIVSDFTHIVSAGGDSSCLVSGLGWRLSCMGSNRDGQLGLGATSTASTPTLVPSVSDSVEGAALADSHSLFLAHPGDIFITGTNSFGELGNRTITDSIDTVQVLLTLNFSATIPSTTTSVTATATTTTTEKDNNTGTREVNNDLTDSEYWIWIGAIAVGVVALVINVVFQRRAASQLEDDDDPEESSAQQREMELIRAEISA